MRRGSQWILRCHRPLGRPILFSSHQGGDDMVRLWLFLLLVGLTFVPSAVHAQTTDGQESICADPAVVACDNFETREVGKCDNTAPIFKFPWPGWGIPNS